MYVYVKHYITLHRHYLYIYYEKLILVLMIVGNMVSVLLLLN